MATAQKLMERAYIHRMCKVGELTEAMTERIRLQLQPIIDSEKQKRLVKMQKERNAMKPILPRWKKNKPYLRCVGRPLEIGYCYCTCVLCV